LLNTAVQFLQINSIILKRFFFNLLVKYLIATAKRKRDS